MILCGAAMLPVSVVAPITMHHKIFDRNATNVPIETPQMFRSKHHKCSDRTAINKISIRKSSSPIR